MSETSWRIEVEPDELARRARSLVRGESGRRARLLFAMVAVLSAVGVVDGLVGRTSPAVETPFAGAATGAAASPGPPGVVNPVTSVTGTYVAPSDAESSAWFCAGASGTGGSAAGTLVLTNPTPRRVAGNLTVVPSSGNRTTVPVSVPARTQVAVVPAQVLPGPWVAATVLFEGGGVGVSEVVDGPLGWSSAPCASETSSTWFFAHGSTASGATLTLLLYNPSTTDAVADVTLDSTTAGLISPPAYQGIGVSAQSLVVENVGDHLTNDASFATEVSTTSGTVVANEVQSTPVGSVNTTAGSSAGANGANAGSGSSGLGGGTSLLLGAPSTSTRWDFPVNVDPQGGRAVFHIYNPSGHEAAVDVDVGLSEGQAEPLTIRVPPQSTTDLVAESVTRIPTDGPYSLLFSSQRGVGIVVDREVLGPTGTPAPQVGLVHGVAGAARSVLLPGLISSAATGAVLSIANLSSGTVTATVEDVVSGAAIGGVSHRAIEPGTTLSIGSTPGAQIGVQPMLVTASGPVAVELDAAPVGAFGAVVVPMLVTG